MSGPDDEDAIAATIAPPSALDVAADVTIAAGSVAGGLKPATTTPIVRAGPTSSPRRPATAPAPADGDDPPLPTVEPALYTTADEIARGGMGRIIAATDTRLGRPVALKELLAHGPESGMRFRREALITARLQHPAIVPVYEAGQWPGGEPFFAMKLVAGKPLDAVIGACRTLEERLALLPSVIAVCDAIAYAHSQRIVHRDLKPSNVLVGDFGETVVIDWGLAKDLDVPEAPRDAAEAAEAARPSEAMATYVPAESSATRSRGTLTIAGAVMGTPAYMPPEQARGDAVDERADVFSLGAMLYHTLAGTPPYGAKVASEVLAAAITGKVVPLRNRAPRAPADLAAIVDRAMSVEPEGRYRTARELAEELRRYQTGQLVGAHRYTTWERVSRFVRRHRAAVTIAAVAIVGFAVGGTLAIRSIVHERDRAQAARAVAEGRRAAAEKLVDFMVSDMRDRLESVGKLDLMAGLGENVKGYYDEMSSLPGGMRPEDVDRMAGALAILGEAEKQSGDLDASMRTFEDARTRLRALVDADATSPETAKRRRVVADATQMIGAIQQARGTFEAAMASYREAIDLYTQARADATPADREVLLGEADAHDHLGDLLRNRGTPEDALVEYEAARRLRQDVVDRTGTIDGDLRASYDLSTSEMKLGSAEQNRGASTAALEHYRAAVARRERLVAVAPDQVEYQHGLAYIRGVLADLLRETGAVEEARDTYVAALAVLDTLVRRDPDNTEWRRDRGTNLANLGFALQDLGDARGALAQYDEAMANHAELTARDPDNASWQMDLSRTQTRAGDAHLFLGEIDAALASHRAALEIRQALVDRDDTSTPWRRALAWSHHKIAAVLEASGDLDGALEAANRALELRTALVDGAPKVAGLRNELALSEIMVGRLLRLAGQPGTASTHLDKALDLARALVDSDAENLEWKEGLCAALTGKGALGDAASAAEAITLADGIAQAHPENAGWQVALAQAHWAARTPQDRAAARAILAALDDKHELGFDNRWLLAAVRADR